MATEVVRDITEWVNFTVQGREAHEGSKMYPEVISRTTEVPWVKHFVAQEAALMVTKRSAQGSRASVEVTRGE